MSAVTLVYCGFQVQPPSGGESLSSAERIVLEKRLKKTAEVKDKLMSLHRALAPLDRILTDVSAAIDKERSEQLQAQPSDPYRNVIERLREALKEAARGLVDYRADGSWAIAREISLPLNRASIECQKSKLELVGARVEDHEELLLSLGDCISPENLKIARVRVYPDRIDATVYPETLDRLIEPGIKVAECEIHIRKDNESELHCEAMKLGQGALSLQIEPFDLRDSRQGMETFIRMELIGNREQKSIAQLEIEAKAGQKARIDLRGRAN